MKLESELGQLIEAYIDEVGVNLPKKKRADIAAEIRSLILDALEDRSEGVAPDEGLVLDILKEFGPPVDVAASYHRHNYVIGPSMYAPFWHTVRGAFMLIVVLFLIGFGVGLIQNSPQSLEIFIESLGGVLANFWDSALQAFAIIVLVFILLERTIPQQDWVGQLKAWGALNQIPFLREMFGRTTASEIPISWDPASLKSTPKAERVSRGETIFEVAVIILVAILFNFFAHRIGAFGLHNGQPWFIPLVSATFGTYLPWWNLYWMLTIGLNFVLLAQGNWTPLTRWTELGLLIFSGIIVLYMLLGPPILGLNPDYLAQADVTANAIQLTEEFLLPILQTILEVFLVLHLIGKCIKLLVKLFRLWGKPPILKLTNANGLND